MRPLAQIYGEMHRFIPVLGRPAGLAVAEVPVNHRPREHGRTKFGLERYLRGLLDLLAVVFIGRYGNPPAAPVRGRRGLSLRSSACVIEIYLTIVKIGGESIGERPLLLLGVLLIVVGMQLFSLGLLAQMLVVLMRESARGWSDVPQVEREVSSAGAAVTPGRERSATGTIARE